MHIENTFPERSRLAYCSYH